MSSIPALHPVTRAWLLDGPLSLHVPAYVSRLKRGRYAATTAGRCLGAVAHFAHWMSMSHLPVHVPDDDCIDFFLRYHVACCDCPAPVVREPRDLHAALVPLLAILRERHVIAEPVSASGPVADELGRYDAHMRDAQGLARATRPAACASSSGCCAPGSRAERCSSENFVPRTFGASSPGSWSR